LIQLVILYCVVHHYNRVMRRKTYAGVSALIVLVILLLLSALLPGCSEEAPPLRAGEESGETVLLAPGLSLDQDQIIEEFGYPEQFFISIDPYSGDRVEDWFYYSEGKVLKLKNGRLFGEEDIEDQSEEYPPTDLKPEDFDSLMTPAEAEELLGEPVVIYDAEGSLMAENTLIVFEKASLVYQGDQLIGVDTQVSPPQLPSP
jgi:hypothetical protein